MPRHKFPLIPATVTWIPNIRHLAALAATVEHGTVTRAAQAVNLTQPALTQAIARLERELDCQLFERGSAGMRPTPPARLLARRASAAIALIGSSRVTGPQVRAFRALAQAGSYSGASEATGLAAASIHRAVADLSLALGERLVERRGRHLVLTRRGEARARFFGLALAELRSGHAELADYLGRQGSRIVIGAMPLSRARWLPLATSRFREHYPDVDVAIIEGSHGELAGPLRSGEIDFLLGAVRGSAVKDDLIEEAMFVDRPMLVMRRGHPLSQANRLGIAEARNCEWILPGPRTPLRNYWHRMMTSEGGDPPRVAIECGSVLTVRELLLASDRISLLSRDQLRVEIEAGLLVALDPPRPIERMIGITTRRDWRPTGPQQAMLLILREIANDIS